MAVSFLPIQSLPVKTEHNTQPCFIVRTGDFANSEGVLRNNSLMANGGLLRNQLLADTSCTSISATSTPKQTATGSRRNARERNRVRKVNQGFDTLARHVPSGKKKKKLSKVETLRSAVDYIRQLQDLLEVHDQAMMTPQFGADFVTSGSRVNRNEQMVIHDQMRVPLNSSHMSLPSPSTSVASSLSSSSISYESDGSPQHHLDDLMDISCWL